MSKKIEDISQIYKSGKILEENPINKGKITIRDFVGNGTLIEENPKITEEILKNKKKWSIV